MPPHGPILSVCIPTYNRCDLLNQGLLAIAQQMVENCLGPVEVIVSDNASSDETSQIIERFTREYPEICLRYFRHPENVGATRNICFATQATTGDFIYLLSDDDILLPGALEKIIAEIQAHPDLDAICPRVSGFTASPENVKPKRPGNDDLLMDRNQTLTRLGTMLTFMSSVVFRKDVVSTAVLNNAQNIFPHSFMFLAAIAREKGCLFLSQDCLAARANESVGYDLIQAFVTDFLAVLRYAEQIGYSPQTIRTVLSANARWLAGAIYHFKKTSYRPSMQKRVGDTWKVLAVWWREPLALLRVEAAIWLPFSLLGRLRIVFKFGRSSETL